MELNSLTYFDLGVLSVLGLSALLSFFRGFVREVLSLGAWFGAGLVTLYAFPHVAAILSHHIANKTVASGFAAMLTFVLALIAISVVSSILLKFVKSGSDVGLLDHGMGFLFGLARGALMVAIAYFIYTQLFAVKDAYPDWVKNAVTRPYVARAAHVIAKLAPSYLDELSGSKTHHDGSNSSVKNSTPGQDVEDDISNDVKNSTPNSSSTIDWPTSDDLKQRVQRATEGK